MWFPNNQDPLLRIISFPNMRMERSKSISLGKSKQGYYLIILAAALSVLIHVISKPMLESSENLIEINPVVII